MRNQNNKQLVILTLIIIVMGLAQISQLSNDLSPPGPNGTGGREIASSHAQSRVGPGSEKQRRLPEPEVFGGELMEVVWRNVPLINMMNSDNSAEVRPRSNEVETLFMDCAGSKSLHSRFLSLRLKGNCAFKVSAITNKTNGYTASIFLGDKGFSTDYIALVEGENTLEISYKDQQNQDINKKIAVFVTE